MTALKVIVSGGVIEVYQYEKDPMTEIQKGKEEKYNQYEKMVLGTQNEEKSWIYAKDDRVGERRNQTVREARNLTRRLALMNFGSGDTFITLTYPNERHLTENDIEIADNDFKKFMQRFNYRYGKVKYLAVREFTKRGRIHFHLLTDWKPTVKNETDLKLLEVEFATKVWKHGFVDIKVMAAVDNVGAYLIKYMTKEVSCEAFKGHKAYLCSKGLQRPMEYRGDEANAIVQAYELKNKKEVFTNSYISDYLGEIVYKEYNLSRLD